MAITETTIHHLIGISQALAGHTDPGEAFRATAEEIASLIVYDHIDLAIMLNDRSQHVVYEVGPRTSWSNMLKTPLPTHASPARLVLLGQEPYLLTPDAQTDPRFHFEGALDEPIFVAGLRSRIVVPMRNRGDIVGTLNISRHVPDCYTLEDVRIAQVCADILTPYITALLRTQEARRAIRAETRARRNELDLRRGASRLTEDMDRERGRLAMDLHDQTLADLARIARHVAALRAEGGASEEDLVELSLLVNGCLTELRGVIENVQPSLLQLFGLRDAIEAHLVKSVTHHKPAVETRVRDLSQGAIGRITDPARTALYRIAQEAINNAARHSGASLIEVTLEPSEQGVRISVKDNGTGLKRSDRRPGTGGLSHMKTRATLIGATLRTESAAPGGTRVTVDYSPSARLQEPSPRTRAFLM